MNPASLLGGQCALDLGQDVVSIFRFGSLGLIISGSQLDGAAAVYVGPAITNAMDSTLPPALAVQIGHRAATSDGATPPARP